MTAGNVEIENESYDEAEEHERDGEESKKLAPRLG